jgi:hypothetical protein
VNGRNEWHGCSVGRPRALRRGTRVLELLARPTLAYFATCWLVDHGICTEKELYDSTTPFVFVDVLAHRMITGGLERLLSTLAIAGDEQRQSELLEARRRAPIAATDLVVAGIDKVHPSKIVTKLARQALFKLSSSAHRE